MVLFRKLFNIILLFVILCLIVRAIHWKDARNRTPSQTKNTTREEGIFSVFSMYQMWLLTGHTLTLNYLLLFKNTYANLYDKLFASNITELITTNIHFSQFNCNGTIRKTNLFLFIAEISSSIETLCYSSSIFFSSIIKIKKEYHFWFSIQNCNLRIEKTTFREIQRFFGWNKD